MSILIKGMEMPKDGDVLTVKKDVDGKIYIKQSRTLGYSAELIELPAQHGRLIDADALIKGHFSDEHRIAMSYADKCWMRRIINGEPTIIPASKEEKEETE